MSNEAIRNHGWTVTFAGTGINLALGVLYAWSIIVGNVDGWTQTQKSIPYSVACLVFALTMIPAGRLQDKFSPRFAATIGGILTGIGFIICALTGTFMGYLIGFGLFAGVGIGFGYASATPPAIKWFPAAKTGLIAGLVVSGFGLASAYIAPLVGWMVSNYGLSTSLMILGVAFLVIVVGCAQLLKNPPAGYTPQSAPSPATGKPAAPAPAANSMTWKEMIKTHQFWILWVMYVCGAGAGLMVIGKLKPIVNDAVGEMAWLAFVLLAVGNAAGRIVAGIVSDKIGRTMTMFLVFMVQAGVMVGLIYLSSVAAIIYVLAFMAGFNYGANLSVFPSATKDLFGLKNFGTNYGIMFSAWGVGGVILPIVAGRVVDATGNFNMAYIIAATCLVIASILSLIVGKRSSAQAAA
jgi:MFS transporter, OFA family, oxalate/formate antiporter